MHWGREFIKIAGNSNFNYLLDAFLSIFAPIVHTRVFRPFSFAPLVYVVSFPNLLLIYISDCFPELSVFSVTKMMSDIAYARARASILRSSGHSVKEIGKFFNKTVRWVSKWSKRECFENKPRSRRPSVMLWPIHRMQIWRTTRLAPGTSMKVRAFWLLIIEMIEWKIGKQ